MSKENKQKKKPIDHAFMKYMNLKTQGAESRNKPEDQNLEEESKKDKNDDFTSNVFEQMEKNKTESEETPIRQPHHQRKKEYTLFTGGSLKKELDKVMNIMDPENKLPKKEYRTFRDFFGELLRSAEYEYNAAKSSRGEIKEKCKEAFKTILFALMTKRTNEYYMMEMENVSIEHPEATAEVIATFLDAKIKMREGENKKSEKYYTDTFDKILNRFDEIEKELAIYYFLCSIEDIRVDDTDIQDIVGDMKGIPKIPRNLKGARLATALTNKINKLIAVGKIMGKFIEAIIVEIKGQSAKMTTESNDRLAAILAAEYIIVNHDSNPYSEINMIASIYGANEESKQFNRRFKNNDPNRMFSDEQLFDENNPSFSILRDEDEIYGGNNPTGPYDQRSPAPTPQTFLNNNSNTLSNPNSAQLYYQRNSPSPSPMRQWTPVQNQGNTTPSRTDQLLQSYNPGYNNTQQYNNNNTQQYYNTIQSQNGFGPVEISTEEEEQKKKKGEVAEYEMEGLFFGKDSFAPNVFDTIVPDDILDLVKTGMIKTLTNLQTDGYFRRKDANERLERRKSFIQTGLDYIGLKDNDSIREFLALGITLLANKWWSNYKGGQKDEFTPEADKKTIEEEMKKEIDAMQKDLKFEGRDEKGAKIMTTYLKVLRQKFNNLKGGRLEKEQFADLFESTFVSHVKGMRTMCQLADGGDENPQAVAAKLNLLELAKKIDKNTKDVFMSKELKAYESELKDIHKNNIEKAVEEEGKNFKGDSDSDWNKDEPQKPFEVMTDDELNGWNAHFLEGESWTADEIGLKPNGPSTFRVAVRDETTKAIKMISKTRDEVAQQHPDLARLMFTKGTEMVVPEVKANIAQVHNFIGRKMGYDENFNGDSEINRRALAKDLVQLAAIATCVQDENVRKDTIAWKNLEVGIKHLFSSTIKPSGTSFVSQSTTTELPEKGKNGITTTTVHMEDDIMKTIQKLPNFGDKEDIFENRYASCADDARKNMGNFIREDAKYIIAPYTHGLIAKFYDRAAKTIAFGESMNIIANCANIGAWNLVSSAGYGGKVIGGCVKNFMQNVKLAMGIKDSDSTFNAFMKALVYVFWRSAMATAAITITANYDITLVLFTAQLMTMGYNVYKNNRFLMEMEKEVVRRTEYQLDLQKKTLPPNQWMTKEQIVVNLIDNDKVRNDIAKSAAKGEWFPKMGYVSNVMGFLGKVASKLGDQMSNASWLLPVVLVGQLGFAQTALFGSASENWYSTYLTLPFFMKDAHKVVAMHTIPMVIKSQVGRLLQLTVQSIFYKLSKNYNKKYKHRTSGVSKSAVGQIIMESHYGMFFFNVLSCVGVSITWNYLFDVGIALLRQSPLAEWVPSGNMADIYKDIVTMNTADAVVNQHDDLMTELFQLYYPGVDYKEWEGYVTGLNDSMSTSPIYPQGMNTESINFRKLFPDVKKAIPDNQMDLAFNFYKLPNRDSPLFKSAARWYEAKEIFRNIKA